MSDLEVPGDALGQAVVAHAVGASIGGGGRHAGHDHRCANCGAGLTGRFCAQCGQSAHVHRSLLHLVEELLHGIFHFETKAWRTLPLLLLKPGRLTREYIDGRRARYVGPLPLFLFMMFVMFLAFSFTGGKPPPTGEQGRAQAAQTRVALQKARAELAALPAGSEQRDVVQANVEALESQLAELTLVPGLAQGDGKVEDNDYSEARIHKELARNAPFLARPALERKLAHALQNQDLALYKIKGGAAKFAILLVPITLPFLGLLFLLRRDVNMFDHAVFSFYSLSAVAVLMTLVALLDVAGLDAAAGLLAFFAPPVHLFAQLKGTYGLGRWGALWRTAALLVYAALALLAYFIIVVLISM